ncbi:unnamed protein product [Knipowitschia caucasica]|uniref:SH3 domain-containing kinase-binding protein 1-like n=1 Tax=Knipowitschia caucasica TaxID=637954 RepID=A0AAV2JA60_KNICA
MEKGKEDLSEETSYTSVEATKTETSASNPDDPLSSLLPKALSAVLHHNIPPGHGRNHPTRLTNQNSTPNSPDLKQLQNELLVLKGQFEQMKAQHNKEIKLLMNELDEEKKIRLTLQMEIKHIKKHMSK